MLDEQRQCLQIEIVSIYAATGKLDIEPGATSQTGQNVLGQTVIEPRRAASWTRVAVCIEI
jgi:hypothetical protein